MSGNLLPPSPVVNRPSVIPHQVGWAGAPSATPVPEFINQVARAGFDDSFANFPKDF